MKQDDEFDVLATRAVIAQQVHQETQGWSEEQLRAAIIWLRVQAAEHEILMRQVKGILRDAP